MKDTANYTALTGEKANSRREFSSLYLLCSLVFTGKAHSELGYRDPEILYSHCLFLPKASEGARKSCCFSRSEQMAATETDEHRRAQSSVTAPPPPLIGKAGRYTVFITPPPLSANVRSAASPSPNKSTPKSKNAVDLEAQKPLPASPSKGTEASTNSFLSKISNAIAKIQSVHSAVDEYLAEWFGLNQSKYQWYVDEYLEIKKMETQCGKPREALGKGIEMPMVRDRIVKR
eukprot:TRINITY_DN11197_c0_g2_i1.p1 TRINITY_DN11197_c0_g2~~TRINITY_DN11197_c0_g2_i1.p1  ORF type:complete len:232 (-),score=42.16 TRINITY_DN11197_c0_g2_i1:484-1179(-)